MSSDMSRNMSLAHSLSVERHASVVYLVTAVNATREKAALADAYRATDRQLDYVRWQSAWPAPRSGARHRR